MNYPAMAGAIILPELFCFLVRTQNLTACGFAASVVSNGIQETNKENVPVTNWARRRGLLVELGWQLDKLHLPFMICLPILFGIGV
jgi:hypothetical protein